MTDYRKIKNLLFVLYIYSIFVDILDAICVTGK